MGSLIVIGKVFVTMAVLNRKYTYICVSAYICGCFGSKGTHTYTQVHMYVVVLCVCIGLLMEVLSV